MQIEKLDLLSDVRNQGVGSCVIHDVITEAEALPWSIRLQVLRVNTSAQRFYGFDEPSEAKAAVMGGSRAESDERSSSVES